ncbi:hypothetical protein KQI63_13200 [bacterium]|nr:hypothetical protein [bacterium]
MTSDSISIMRLVIAGVNGILFAFGIVLILEMVIRRPKRWRDQLRALIARAEQLDLADDPEAKEVRLKIDELKLQMQQHHNNPRSLLTIGFGILMIILAIFSLISLVAPPFAPFS